MLERFRRAMKYWMLAVSRPGGVLDVAQRDMHKVRISFYIVLAFSVIYSATAFLLWTSGRIPVLESWLPFVQGGRQYLLQAFLALPWMVVAWLCCAGFIYLFTCLAGKEAFYEDALMISALSICIPYLMFWWIPETFLFPFMGEGNALRWPELFELERKYAFPGLWQLAMVAFGMRRVNNTNRSVCVAAGLFCVAAFLGLWLPFMR